MSVTWFKVLNDIFADDKIKIIQSMPEGDALLIMWFKILSQASKTNDGGYIYLKKNIPYTAGMLSTLFGKQQQLVELALRTFNDFGMIDIDERGFIFITNWEKHQSIDKLNKIKEQDRIRAKEYRDRKKQDLLENVTNITNRHVTITLPSQQNHDTDLDVEKELKDIADSGESAFNEFWKLYPSKKGKANALKSWRTLWKKGLDTSKVMSGTQSYIEYCRKTDRPFKDGSTFVNGQCWNDDWSMQGSNKSKGFHQQAAKIEEITSEDEELLNRAYGSPSTRGTNNPIP